MHFYIFIIRMYSFGGVEPGNPSSKYARGLRSFCIILALPVTGAERCWRVTLRLPIQSSSHLLGAEPPENFVCPSARCSWWCCWGRGEPQGAAHSRDTCVRSREGAGALSQRDTRLRERRRVRHGTERYGGRSAESAARRLPSL